MPTIEELQPLLSEPREDLAVEYKNWLDLTTNEHRATLAKAVIALANHGGGYVVLGFDDNAQTLMPVSRPTEIHEVSQDSVNAVVRRFATPEFHCVLHNVPHPNGQTTHPIVVVPGNMTEPVMSRRDCQGVISQNRCYIRKPGPRSEEPQTAEEWRVLLRRCVLAGREDMLEAIRSIVSGRVETAPLPPNIAEELHAFCEAARERWSELVEELPTDAPARFPLGFYEMGFSLVGAQPANNFTELQTRWSAAHRIKLTGWPVFIDMNTREWAPYLHDNFMEAWVGRPRSGERYFEDAAHTDFWRASLDGKLYTIRGFQEDSEAGRVSAGEAIDITLPIWRIGEGILFATRFAGQFEDVEAIAVECRFTGLNNRYLTSLDRSRGIFDDRISRTSEIALSGQANLDQLRDNLTEFLHQLLTPLYERFNFFSLPLGLVETELSRLRDHRV